MFQLRTYECIDPLISKLKGKLTILQSVCHHGCHWSISLTVDSKDGAVVGGGRCEPLQCEVACLCVLHENAPHTSLRGTGEGVSSDHPIALCGIRRIPRTCHVPCSRSEYEVQW